jgi:acyl carrier protein
METAPKIREFIKGHLVLLENDPVLNDDDDIFELGYVDSLFALQLVNFIESEFGLELMETDLDVVNFSSVNRIVSFIQTKTGEENG